MSEEYISALLAAKEYGLYLKVVTSVKYFDTYNSFFNIFDQQEEPCRRIVVLTKTKDLEEVYDENPTEDICQGKIVDDNMWIKSYSLLTAPEKIELNNVIINKELLNRFLDN